MAISLAQLFGSGIKTASNVASSVFKSTPLGAVAKSTGITKALGFERKTPSRASRVRKMIKRGYLRSASYNARMGRYGRAKKMYLKGTRGW